jgi:hypothetical protein
MKEYAFPTKRDFILAGIAAVALLHETSTQSHPAVLPVPLVPPIEIPAYHPFVGPLPYAVRRECKDLGKGITCWERMVKHQ